MDLPHAGDDHLLGLGIAVGLQRRLLFDHPVEGVVDLVLVCLGLGLDGVRDDRQKLLRRLIDDRLRLIAEGVAGHRLLQLGNGDDIAGHRLFDRLLLLPFQLVYLPDPLLHIPGGIVGRGIGIEDSGIDPHDGDLAGVGIGRGLEYEGGEGFLLVRRPLDHLLGFRVSADRLGPVQGRREVINNGVEELGHPDVLGRGTAQHCGEGVTHGADPETVDDLLFGKFADFEKFFGQGIIGLGNGLHHLLTEPLGFRQVLSRDSAFREFSGKILGIPVGFHLHQVYDPFEIFLCSHRYLDGDTPCPQGLLHVVDGTEEIGPFPVQLVDEGYPGDFELVGPRPDFLGLGLDSGNGGEDHHRAVKCPHTGAGIGDEVAVSGSVHNMNEMVVPLAMVERGTDGYLPLGLLRFVVHRGGAVVDAAQAVNSSRVEQYSLGQRCLAGPAMCNDSQVPQLCSVVLGHRSSRV